MQSIKSISLAPVVNGWLESPRQPRILHVFDKACNLINERREVLSVVTPQIGNGPFNLIIEEEICFTEHLSLQSSISVSSDQLTIGDLIIHTADAKLWYPYPDWEFLHGHKETILSRLTQLPITNYLFANHQFSNSLVSNLCSSLVAIDISTAKSLAAKLAGLGIGLTPSGDDFIMGAIYAIWIVHPYEIASALIKDITEATVPLTTSLSGAYLEAAGKGEAGILWHNFFNALLEDKNIGLPITKLRSVGETSGADALAGFFGVISAFKELIINECPS